MTWILIASRAGARIVEQQHDDWTLLEEIENDAGRLRNSQLDSDRPGRTFSRTTAARHALSPAECSHDVVAERFARALAEHLDRARMEGRFSSLVLVAEPHFLGMLHNALSPNLVPFVRNSIGKDLHRVALRELGRHLH